MTRESRRFLTGWFQMEKLEIGIALVRKLDSQIKWLGKIDRTIKQVDFIMARRLERESMRESVLREVSWELDIDRRRDIVVSNMAQLNLDFETTLLGDGEPSIVSCAFYNVELYRKTVVQLIEEKEDFIWMTSAEICSGTTDDGMELNPLMVELNNQAKVIQPWESDLTGEDQ